MCVEGENATEVTLIEREQKAKVGNWIRYPCDRHHGWALGRYYLVITGGP